MPVTEVAAARDNLISLPDRNDPYSNAQHRHINLNKSALLNGVSKGFPINDLAYVSEATITVL
ncbi:hypothetical protein D3C75_1243370 [compost metagenome]